MKTLLYLALSTPLFLGCVFNHTSSSLKVSSLSKEDRIKKETKEFSIDGISNIEIEAKFTDFFIERTSEDKLSYSLVQELEEDSDIDCLYKVESTLKQESLILTFHEDKNPQKTSHNCNVSRVYRVKIPQIFKGSLKNQIEHSNSELHLDSLDSFSLEQEFGTTYLEKSEISQIKMNAKHAKIDSSELNLKNFTLSSKFSKFNLKGTIQNILLSSSEHDSFIFSKINSEKMLIEEGSFSSFTISGSLHELKYQIEHGSLSLNIQNKEPIIKGESEFTNITIILDPQSHFTYRLLGDFTTLSSQFPITLSHKNILEGDVGEKTGSLLLKSEHGSIKLRNTN